MTEKEVNKFIENIIPELSFLAITHDPMDTQWAIDYAKDYAKNYLRKIKERKYKYYLKKKGEKDGKKKTNQCKIGQKDILPNRNQQKEH